MSWSFCILIIIIVIFCFRPLRRKLISSWIMRLIARVLPVLGDTERIALEAGTVGFEGDLFSGKPRWQKLLRMPKPRLSAAETAFLNNEVEELCLLLDDWQIRQQQDLPQNVWAFLKEKRFLGLI